MFAFIQKNKTYFQIYYLKSPLIQIINPLIIQLSIYMTSNRKQDFQMNVFFYFSSPSSSILKYHLDSSM